MTPNPNAAAAVEIFADRFCVEPISELPGDLPTLAMSLGLPSKELDKDALWADWIRPMWGTLARNLAAGAHQVSVYMPTWAHREDPSAGLVVTIVTEDDPELVLQAFVRQEAQAKAQLEAARQAEEPVAVEAKPPIPQFP